MNLRTLLLFIYLLISSILFVSFRPDIFVWFSFFANFSILSIIVYHHLFIEKHYSPFISAYIVFNFLFLLMAPMIQIGGFNEKKNVFAQLFPYNESLTIKTNFFIIIFHIIFFISYLYYKKKFKDKLENIYYKKKDANLPLTIFVLSLVSVVIFILSYSFMMEEIARPSWQKSSYTVIQLLVQKKVLFMVPFGGLVLSFFYLKNIKKITPNTVFIFFIFLFMIVSLFWFKNPLTEKRNALGPIYISLIFLFLPRLLNSNTKMLLFLFFSMVVIFPLVQIFTHVEYSFQEIINNPKYITDEFSFDNFSTTYNTLNYDAFSNISATIEYVSINGLSYGYQLLSGLLFFIPRSIWTSKPNSSGELIGDYVIDSYGFSFNNLSNPLVSEGYLNFGILGIILMAIVLAYFIVKFMIWLKQKDELKKIMAFYFAIHLIFFLRGDFTNGFVYFIGVLIGVLVIPKTIRLFINLLPKKAT